MQCPKCATHMTPKGTKYVCPNCKHELKIYSTIKSKVLRQSDSKGWL